MTKAKNKLFLKLINSFNKAIKRFTECDFKGDKITTKSWQFAVK